MRKINERKIIDVFGVKRNKMTGTWQLIKLILRRDRIKLPIWILSISLFLLYMIPLLKNSYGTPESLQTLYDTFRINPAGLLLTGMMDAPTFGALFTIETVLWWGFAIIFMNTLLVIRHTRQNEETGAQELIMSTNVHRNASAVAVIIVAFFANLILGILIALGMITLSDGDALWSNSQVLLYSSGMTLLGFVWAIIALIVAQLVESARSVNGILAGLIGISFLLRGIGDFLGQINSAGLVQPNWISNLSPFGWIQATRSLTFPDWQPLLIPIIFIIIALPIAFVMLNRRDIGSGLLPSRKGRACAGIFRRSALGLTCYLQRNIFFGWLIGVISMTAICGALVSQMSNVYDSSPQLAQVISAMGGTGAQIPVFLSAMLMIVILMTIAYAIQSSSKLKSEEFSGHLENLITTKLSRIGWLLRHFFVILTGILIILIVAGFTLGLATNLSGENVNIGEYILAALSYFPVVSIFAAGYICLFGLFPRIAGLLIWIYFGFVTFVSWIGELINLPKWLNNFSPLHYVASAPAENIKIQPLIIIALIAIILTIIGIVSWRQRDTIKAD